MGYSSYYNYYGYSSPYSSDAATSTVLGALGAFFGVIMLFVLVVGVLQIIAMWKLFTKAGEKGWKSIIPIYNLVIMYKISGVSPWLLLIYLASFIPFIGTIAILILNIYQTHQFSKSFGKDAGYTVGLIFLPVIFYMILAFGSAEYVGPGGKEAETASADAE